MLKKAFVYIRVSKDEGDYERQVKDIKSFMENNGYERTDVKEEDITGTKKNRPFIQQLIPYFKQHPDIKYLIVQELSRLGRTYEVPPLIEELNKIGVCTIAIGMIS